MENFFVFALFSQYVLDVLVHDERMDPVFTPSDVEEFRTAWREEFGEDLPREKAVVIADRFLRTIHLIVKLADRADAKVAARMTIDEHGKEMAK